MHQARKFKKMHESNSPNENRPTTSNPLQPKPNHIHARQYFTAKQTSMKKNLQTKSPFRFAAITTIEKCILRNTSQVYGMNYAFISIHSTQQRSPHSHKPAHKTSTDIKQHQSIIPSFLRNYKRGQIWQIREAPNTPLI